MSRFKEIPKYKNEILMKLVSSENIVRAISNQHENFLDHPVENPYGLIYDKIFPYNRVPNVDDSRNVYITTKYGGYKIKNRVIKSGYITFLIYTHVDLMRTDYGTLRNDYLLSEIDELFNESTDFGIGRLTFDGADEFSVNEKYMGLWIRYKVVDFN